MKATLKVKIIKPASLSNIVKILEKNIPNSQEIISIIFEIGFKKSCEVKQKILANKDAVQLAFELLEQYSNQCKTKGIKRYQELYATPSNSKIENQKHFEKRTTDMLRLRPSSSDPEVSDSQKKS